MGSGGEHRASCCAVLRSRSAVAREAGFGIYYPDGPRPGGARMAVLAGPGQLRQASASTRSPPSAARPEPRTVSGLPNSRCGGIIDRKFAPGCRPALLAARSPPPRPGSSSPRAGCTRARSGSPSSCSEGEWRPLGLPGYCVPRTVREGQRSRPLEARPRARRLGPEHAADQGRPAAPARLRRRAAASQAAPGSRSSARSGTRLVMTIWLEPLPPGALYLPGADRASR